MVATPSCRMRKQPVSLAPHLLQKRCRTYSVNPRGLTLRSSGAPTAGHQRPAGGTQYIFATRALASCRCRPLNSNVRPRTNTTLRVLPPSSPRCACRAVRFGGALQKQVLRRQRSRPLAFAGQACAPPRPMTWHGPWSRQRTSQLPADECSWSCPASRARRKAPRQAAVGCRGSRVRLPLRPVFRFGTANSRSVAFAAVASAERVAPRLAQVKLPGTGAEGDQRGLTTRSSGPATAGHLGPD